MKEQCLDLQRNDPGLTDFNAITCSSEDCAIEYLQLLGQSLIGNTHLRKLKFPPLLLTESVTQALVAGLRQSKVKRLSFCDYIEEPSGFEPSGFFLRILFDEIRFKDHSRNSSL
jgi:hypothetical protein